MGLLEQKTAAWEVSCTAEIGSSQSGGWNAEIKAMAALVSAENCFLARGQCLLSVSLCRGVRDSLGSLIERCQSHQQRVTLRPPRGRNLQNKGSARAARSRRGDCGGRPEQPTASCARGKPRQEAASSLCFPKIFIHSSVASRHSGCNLDEILIIRDFHDLSSCG